MDQKIWTHKEHAKKKFIGGYKRTKSGKRRFVLDSPKDRPVTFKHWQAAAAAGWKKK